MGWFGWSGGSPGTGCRGGAAGTGEGDTGFSGATDGTTAPPMRTANTGRTERTPAKVNGDAASWPTREPVHRSQIFTFGRLARSPTAPGNPQLEPSQKSPQNGPATAWQPTRRSHIRGISPPPRSSADVLPASAQPAQRGQR